MKDLTQGPIYKHLIFMSIPIMIGMFVQTLYFLVDLYFIGQLGDVALAGVSSAGTLFFFVMALTQVLNVGVGTLVSHAVGRKDPQKANLIFNQGLCISIFCMLILAMVGVSAGPVFFSNMAPDKATFEAGISYFYWFLPTLLLQFPMTVIVAALRGAGVVKQPMMISMLAVVINIVLSPMLITGWGFGIEMGVAGAALASSLATTLGLLALCWYFHFKESYLHFSIRKCMPKVAEIKGIIGLGLPAGGEFLLSFAYMSIIYWVLREFDASAQAGFGVGVRVMQALFLPVMAVAFAAPAVAGQNFAAGNTHRVYQTYHQTALLTCGCMLVLNVICLFYAEHFLAPFSNDQSVILVATIFLSYVCFNFIPAGYVFAASGMFQALGNTWPALISTATRLGLFALPVIWLSMQPGFNMEVIWVFSVATVYVQALVSFILLRKELRKKLSGISARTEADLEGESQQPSNA
ncbi:MULTISPECIES: MATE family efflux transporter [Pseudoalteromonas]|uniref:Multidrug-efflux transporter n=1 Tax=Pseudoalteromonas obscura TaxID=3048491 RepID=A0ABT7EHP6_9GAMM|nr:MULTISPECIES: MATE family efflux transporter [Pseudoalteromonas]MBQ4836236.1 MATE family efflux transporter [Pseudoalteromonas luteoviolacea]MDK2594586.1 MATE family efflux transporter [Pseudoalteromonas sp. P94(2023)]